MPDPFEKYLGTSAAAPVASGDPFAKYLGETAPAPGAAAPASEDKYALSEVPGQAFKNFLPGIWEGMKNAGAAIHDHPLDFALNMLPSHKHKLDMINEMNTKYGSLDAAKTTMAEHPAAFLTDLLTPVSMMAPEMGAATRTGRAAKIAAQIADPAQLAGNVRKAVTGGVGHAAEALTQVEHGVGPGALKELFESGENVTPGVWDAIMGRGDPEARIASLKDSLGQLYEDRGKAYTEGMTSVAGHDTPISFDKIDKAVGSAGEIGVYKAPGDKTPGPGYNYEKNQSVKDARGQILAEIERHRALGPAYHDAAGFDKLKQAIRQIGENLEDPSGMPSRGTTFANKIADAVTKTVSSEAPEYGAVMKKYGEDSGQIRNLIKEFSLNPNANKMTTMRKLQKVWRQSADVAHGERTDFLRGITEQTGNPDLMAQLAGDQYGTWKPRGLRGAFMGAEVPLAAAHALVNPTVGVPALGASLGALALMSPRLAGMGAYGAGRLSASHVGKTLRAGEGALPWAIRDYNATGPQQTPAEARGGYFSGAR